MTDLGWIYLAHERQFQDQSLNIFKTGRTDNIKRRPNGYPKFTRFIFTYYCSDIKTIEDAIKVKFRLRFIPRTDYGSEYFGGDYTDMIDEMIRTIRDYNTYSAASDIPTVPIYKTISHFLNESLESNNDYNNGISLEQLHDYYKQIWLPKNSVEVPYFDQKEFLNKISKFLGIPIKTKGTTMFLGREFINKNFSTRTYKYHDDKDKWAEYREKYLVEDGESSVQWADLRENFRNWHDNKFKNSLKKRADDARKYFDEHLGGYKDTFFKNVKLKGYIGWKLTVDNHCSQ